MVWAPVVLFVFNRPAHTKKTIEALLANEGASQTDVIVYSDGAKHPEQVEAVNEIRHYVAQLTGFKSVTLRAQNQNIGLANSIISGVTDVVNTHGVVIVMEDDLVTSPYFLRYMNEGLALYQNDEKVASIQGFMYPHNATLPETFFIKGADCWGWATWKRAWNHFEPDSHTLLKQLKHHRLEKKFDLDGAYPYTIMLKNQSLGRIQSWAIRWHASLFIKGLVSLYPSQTLVHNIGMDGQGTHKDSSDQFFRGFKQGPVLLEKNAPQESGEGLAALKSFWESTKKPGIFKKLWTLLKR